MRWSVWISEHAIRDQQRLLSRYAGGTRTQAVAEIQNAFRQAGDDPRRRLVEMMPGDRWQRLLDVGEWRLIVDVNPLNVANPDDDLVCCVLGLLRRPT